MKSGREEKGHGCRRSQARENAHKGPDQTAHEAVEKIQGLKGD